MDEKKSSEKIRKNFLKISENRTLFPGPRNYPKYYKGGFEKFK